MKSRFFLNVIVREGAAVLELLASENQTLLIRRDALLILDLRFNIVNRIRRLDLEGNRLPGEGLNEDLHASTETKDEMKGRLLLDVVVRERPAVFKLLASKDKTLLVRGDALLILNFRLDVIYGVG